MITTLGCTSNGFLQALDVVFTAENFLFSLEESESEGEVGNASPYLFLLPLQFVERSLEFVQAFAQCVFTGLALRFEICCRLTHRVKDTLAKTNGFVH